MKKSAVFIFISICVSMLGIPVLAVEENIWREGQSFTIETKPYTSGVVEKGNCTMQTIAVFSSPDLSASRYACVMTNEKIAIARYVADFEERYAVKKSSDVMFHLLANISPRRYTLSMTPQTDYLLLKNSTYSSGVDEAEYELYRDPTTEFEYDALTGTYNLNKEKGHSLFSIQGAAVGETRFSRPAPMAVSNNGKFGFTYTASRLAVVVNLTTGEERVIDKIPRDSSVPDPYAPMAGTISNDGRYAFLTNSDRMYDTSEACGEPLSTILYTNNNPMNHPCPNTNLSALIREKIKYSYNAVLYSFNDDNTALSYITYYNTSPDGIKEEVIIKTEGFGVVKGPKYLALGDSYASGQGDLDAKGIGQYTLDTNQPTGCHISRRAYPYLLARDWGLSDTTMHSIACAGARREPDINSPAASYMGQNKQFSGYNQQDLQKARTDALANYTPGLIPQIEFVKKYQPKFITVMAGGNDVGFAEILSYCAQSMETCQYAKPRTPLYGILENSVKSQYQSTIDMLNEIKKSSPKTVIYVVGYPKFIAEKISIACRASTVGLIDNAEAAAINTQVAELNSRIKSAAKNVGAYYVDTQDSLQGGKLCEKDGKYMTGLDKLPGGLPRSSDIDRTQAFHPNSYGHEQMAKAAKTQYPNMATNIANPVGTGEVYFPPITERVARLMSSTQVVLDPKKFELAIPAGVFKPNSKVLVKIYSHEKKLGTYTLGDSGELKAIVKLPSSIKAGEHVLVVEGIDDKGKNFTGYNFITVSLRKKTHYYKKYYLYRYFFDTFLARGLQV